MASVVVCLSLPVVGLSQTWSPALWPIIQLSPEETAQVRRSAEQLRSARERESMAESEWIRFRDAYQAAHANLETVQFSTDFRLAFASQTSGPVSSRTIPAVELTAEDQHKGQAVYRELDQSRNALQQANVDSVNQWHQVVANHVQANGSGTEVMLPNGSRFMIPAPWWNGVAFTSDFRFAVPASR